MDIVIVVALAVVGALLIVLLALVAVLLVRKSQDIVPVISPLQNMTQVIAALQSDLRVMSERVATLERDQSTVAQSVAAIGSRLAETGSLTQSLVEAASAIRANLAGAQESLTSLQAQAQARQQLEQRTAESIRRLEAVIAGTQTKGVAGENIVEVVFSQLPPEWQARNFQVGNKTVEFGLRLPNNLILPIDSKWAATALLEQFVSCSDVEEQQQLKAQIERAVVSKAREVRKYIDPSVTVNFGIAAVPDAVFDLCSAAQVEALQFNVVIISYSMFVPYLLLAFQTILRSSQDIDVQKLAAYLDSAQGSLKNLNEEVEGRLSRAITMLGNSRDEIRSLLSRVATGLAALQLRGTAPSPEQQLPPAVGGRAGEDS